MPENAQTMPIMTLNTSLHRQPLLPHVHGAFAVTGLPAFNDNYIWVIHQAGASQTEEQRVVVVDPGDAAPVIDYCRCHGCLPEQILLTHHHADHVGGVAELCAWVKQQSQGRELMVYGPGLEGIPGVTHPLQGGESLALAPTVLVKVMSMPGHTRGHLAYVLSSSDQAQPAALFCGDVLFGLGCGRLFEGTAAQMAASLEQIRQLLPDTRVYCAHEYTAMNLPFALAVDPDNAELQARAVLIRQQRQAGEATVPLTLAEECATNPFLRCDQPALAKAAMVPEGATPVDVFTRLRQMRDTFKAPQ